MNFIYYLDPATQYNFSATNEYKDNNPHHQTHGPIWRSIFLKHSGLNNKEKTIM